MIRSLILAVAAASIVAAQDPGPPVRPIVVRASRIVTMEAAPPKSGVVVLRGAKIAAVGESAGVAVEAADVFEFADGIVYPGFIDAGSNAGVRRERDETTQPIEANVRLADAFDPLHRDFGRCLEAGITTTHLVPGDRDLVGGRSAVVKVGREGRVDFLRADAALKLSLCEAEYLADRPRGGRFQIPGLFDSSDDGARPPTSLVGALAVLRHPTPQVAKDLAEARAGTRTVILAARADREVDAAMALSKDLGFKTILCGDVTAGRFAEGIRKTMQGCILDPVLPGRKTFELALLAELAKSGTPIAFATYTPANPPTTLLLSAVVSARLGLSTERTERALTIDAARMLGVDDRVGSIKAGKDADLVVMSGPLTDARSRVLLVIQDGRVVHKARGD